MSTPDVSRVLSALDQWQRALDRSLERRTAELEKAASADDPVRDVPRVLDAILNDTRISLGVLKRELRTYETAKAARNADLRRRLDRVETELHMLMKTPAPGGPVRMSVAPGRPRSTSKAAKLRTERDDLERRADATDDKLLASGYRDWAEDLDDRIDKLDGRSDR